mgnify:CR=1 FL=1
MKILLKIILIIFLILIVGYLLLTRTAYLDFVKNWKVFEVCCINGTDNETADWKTYDYKEVGIKFKYPLDWSVNEGLGSSGNITAGAADISGIPEDKEYVLGTPPGPEFYEERKWLKTGVTKNLITFKGGKGFLLAKCVEDVKKSFLV